MKRPTDRFIAGLASLAVTAFGACPASDPGARRPEPPPLGALPAPLALLPPLRAASGLQVLSLPARGDVFAAAILVPADPRDDPRGLEGLTAFTVDSALLATTADPDRQLRPERRALELGGRIEALHDGVLAGWRVTGPSAARGPLLRLLRDVAVVPAFPATRVQARAEMVREEGEQVRSRALVEARAWAIGLGLGEGRPLRLAPGDATLAAINREDLARHHARLFAPERALAVAEGVPADVLLQALRDWPAPATAPAHSTAAPCPAPHLEQAWLPAPERDAAVILALPVPGLGHPLRPALEGLLLASDALDDGLRPRVELHDRGARSVLLLIASGGGPSALEPIDAWLTRLARLDGPGRATLGERLRRAAGLVAAETARGRVLGAARAFVHAPPASFDLAGDLAALQRWLLLEEGRVRVGVGPEQLLRRMEAWGTVRTLPRAGDLCPAPSAP